MLSVNVSVGEAFDKLSILRVKKKRITDVGPAAYIDDELTKLNRTLAAYLSNPLVSYWLGLLDYIHEKMWDAVDVFHSDKIPTGATPWYSIRDENQARFRVKQKIERITQSTLREQKSHRPQEVHIFGHEKVGDQLTQYGIYRYYSMYYDTVHIYACEQSRDTLRHFLSDDIESYVLHGPLATAAVGGTVIRLGDHSAVAKKWRTDGSVKRFYEFFWSQARVPWSLRWELSASMSLNRGGKQVQRPSVKYVFIHDRHQERVGGVIPYNGPLAVVRPSSGVSLHEYCDVLEGAAEIHVVDSAFFCVCQYLNLSHVGSIKVYPKVWSSTWPLYDLLGYCNPQQRWILVQ